MFEMKRKLEKQGELSQIALKKNVTKTKCDFEDDLLQIFSREVGEVDAGSMTGKVAL